MDTFNRNNILTVAEILEIINPKNSKILDLEDLKSITNKFEPPTSTNLLKFFKEYIFAHKSFMMPAGYLVENFNKNTDKEKTHRRLLSYDSFISKTTDSYPSNIMKTRNTSIEHTYSKIYQQKKMTAKRIFNESQKLYEKIDKKNEPSLKPKKQKENREKQSVYISLLEIRKLHLRRSSTLNSQS